MAPHGLILGENEATPSRKLLKHLPDLKTAININKYQKNSRYTALGGLYVLMEAFAVFLIKTGLGLNTHLTH